MPSDIRAQQAREHHRAAARHGHLADAERQQRDRLIRALRADDPGRWTYLALAKAVGCSPELIAYIVKAIPGQGGAGDAPRRRLRGTTPGGA